MRFTIVGLLALAAMLAAFPARAVPMQDAVPVCTVYTVQNNQCFRTTLPVSPGSRAWVIDGASTTDCATGAGNYTVLCRRTPFGWTADVVGGGGTPNDASVTPAKIGNGDFGAFQCVAGANPCIIDSDAIASAQIVAGTIVDSDVNASAAIAGTKLANTPAGGIAATTVQAAINELDSEKLDIADAIPGWPFVFTVMPSGNPTTYGIAVADKCLVSTSGGTSVACFGSGASRAAGVFKVVGSSGGYVHRLTCMLDAVTGAAAGDVLTIDVVSDTLNGGSLTTMSGSEITFTQGTDLASNTAPKTVAIDQAIPAADAGVQIRAELTDGDASVTSLAFNCTLFGYLP